jgi:two-component system, chemotaxis family, CheB/CheR fusion protein
MAEHSKDKKFDAMKRELERAAELARRSETLRQQSAGFLRHGTDLEKQFGSNRATVRDDMRSRLAALNLMEDAEEARRRSEIETAERQRAEESLRDSEERLRLIVENAREYAIFSTDLERRVTTWNSGAKRILGYSAEEIIGRSADIIFTEEDRAAGACEREAKTALKEERAADERWHVRKDGSRFWGIGAMMAMHAPNGQTVGFVKIFRDQTDAKRIEETLRLSRAELQKSLEEAERARQEAEKANRTKDHFLAALSHELRTPLTPVLMAAESLLLRKDLPPRVVEALEMICRNIQVENHFIDDLLDITRISHGKLELAREPVDIHEAVRHGIEISEPDFRAKEQRLTVQLAATSTQTRGDFARLQQVFWNLLKNASKFTPERGEIRVTSRNNGGDSIVVEVSDNGRGIDPNALEDIFEAFRQEDTSITRKFGGLGLGLAISKATVIGHGGSIVAASDGHGKGSTFKVTLPLQKRD